MPIMRKGGIILPKTTAFISYAHADRKYGAQAKNVLAGIGIEAFLAHDDLHVSDEWRARIIEELRRCHLFVPLLSQDFVKSKWASQEVGFIISRPDVAIAPLSIDGTKPFGFISHLQSRPIPTEGVTRELLLEPLVRRIPRKILPGLIKNPTDVHTFRTAEARMLPLVRYFRDFNRDEAQTLAEEAVRNYQIWSAGKCRTEYLPEFIRVQSKNIKPKTLKALRYQVQNNEKYVEEK